MSHPGSGISQISNQDNQLNHFKLRVGFSQFETTTTQEHLKCYIEKLQRQHCDYSPPDVMILPYHDLLEFMLLGEETDAPAFDFYHIQLQLVQQIHPSCIFFKAQLAEDYFASASHIQSLYQPTVQSTIFKLNTDSGYLETPKLPQPTAQNEIIVSQFKLTILLELFSFAPQPFTDFSKVEVKSGCFHFPLIPSCRGTQNPAQQQHHFRAQPMLDPPLAPPRMMRDDTNMSVPWDHDQQSFMSRDKAKHLNNVKAMFDNRRPSRSSSVSHPRSQQSQPQSQPGSRTQSNVSAPSVRRPVLPNLMQKGFLNTIPTVASSVHVNISQPQPGPAQSGLPPGPAQPGVVQPPPPAPASMGAAGGTNHLLSQTLVDEIDIDLPQITMNLPAFYRTGFGDQGRKYSDPKNILYHNTKDLVWDNSYNIQLTNDIDHHLPNNAPTNSGNPFLPPPLASSTKYPDLPTNSINFYGSGVQSLPQDINQQNQQNVFPAQPTVTQPILSGLTGSQLEVTTTVTSINTPILSTSKVAPAVIIPVSTGARPKVVMSPPPPSILPITDPIQTRSLTGNSRPAPGFMQNVKQTFSNKVKDKQGKGGTRSMSK